jgi:hypothetical protein
VVVDPVNTGALNALLRDMATATDLCTGLLPAPADHIKQRTVALDPVAAEANNNFDLPADQAYAERGRLKLKYKVRGASCTCPGLFRGAPCATLLSLMSS